MTTVLVIRHGQTDAVGQKLVGWTPGILLNKEGARQAQTLAHALEGVHIDAIYSSPLERAAMTAQAIAEPRALTVAFRVGLGEVRFGDWQGKSLAELEDDPWWRHWSLMRTTGRAPGGESMLDTQKRMVDELMAVRQVWPDGTVALVSHGDAIRSLFMYLLGMSMDVFSRLRIDPASVSIIRLTDVDIEIGGINISPAGVAAQLAPDLRFEGRRRS